MDRATKKNLFMAAIVVLVLAVVGVAVYVTLQGPSTPNDSGTQFVDTNEDGDIVINDFNDGEITIPKYNYPVNAYDANFFTNNQGVMKYGDNSAIGINVTSKNGEIDWAQVKQSGVDFVMIRVGYREQYKGGRVEDSNFVQNIEGATEAGLAVGVYFFSQAVSVEEAEQEAAFVIEKIQPYQVTYPISFNWEFGEEKNGDVARTKNCTPLEITSFAKAFCSTVSKTGHTAMFHANKEMAYDNFNLDELSGNQIWYAEYAEKPAFYYDFKIWQYSELAEVPGISGSVKMSLAMEKYSD